jgi:hypothetical protein
MAIRGLAVLKGLPDGGAACRLFHVFTLRGQTVPGLRRGVQNGVFDLPGDPF